MAPAGRPATARPLGRLGKVLGWTIGGVLALVIVLGLALWLGGGRAVAWAVQNPGSALIGRQVRIAGPLTVAWGKTTRIVAQDVQVANASWGSAPQMFVAKRVELDVDLASLPSGTVRIPLLALDGAKLLLEKSKDGVGNWKFTSGTPKKRYQFPDLQHLVVRDSQLTWHNAVTEARTEIGIAQLDYAAPDPTKPVRVAATGSFQHLPARITGELGPLAELRNPSKPYPVKFNGTIGQIDLAVDGTIAKPLDFAGVDLRLSMSGKRLDQLGNALDVPLPQLPDFRGTSVLTGGNGDWALQALSLALGASDLEGGLAINTKGKVPYVRANLTARQLDLADFDGVVGGHPAHSSAPAPRPARNNDRVIPDTHLAVQKLPGLNADLTFDATRIVSASGLPFDRVSLGLKLENGELDVRSLRFHTADGDLDFKLHFTPFTRNTPPRLVGELDVQHIDLHKLLAHSSSPLFRQTAGILGGFVKLDTTGTSMRDLLARMQGDAGIFMQKGQLSALLQQLTPIDVLGAIGVLASGDRPLPINCLVSRFAIKQGIATATTLLFDTENTIVTGAGNLNFADETIDATLTPSNRSFTLVSLRTPVDITGTFAHPSYHLHTGSLIARLGAAIGLGVLAPPAALLPLIDTGLGANNACATAYAAQRPPGNPEPLSGSSTGK